VVAVLTHPAQPLDRSAVLVQGGTSQPPQLVGRWLHAGLGPAQPQVTHGHHAIQHHGHWRASFVQMPVGFQAGRGSWTTPSTPSLLGFSHPEQPSPYPIVLQERKFSSRKLCGRRWPTSTSLYQAEQQVQPS
jgi:hypothetical protein